MFSDIQFALIFGHYQFFSACELPRELLTTNRNPQHTNDETARLLTLALSVVSVAQAQLVMTTESTAPTSNVTISQTVVWLKH